VAVGLLRGAWSRCRSCELVIGPAAVTSSIRRIGTAVETSPVAIEPGDLRCPSVGTPRAARANPRSGNWPFGADATGGSDGVEEDSAGWAAGVHHCGGRTSAPATDRGASSFEAASARRTATGRAMLAANLVDDLAINPMLVSGRGNEDGRPGCRNR
jgi:hypothetical protein